MGHYELLLHTFLRSDSATIAALIYAGGPDAGKQTTRMTNGKIFRLTTEQRAMLLLQDSALGKFAWVHGGSMVMLVELMKRLVEVAREDGYEVSFTALGGSDHVRPTSSMNWGYGTCDTVTSDVSRPSALLGSGGAGPKRLKACEEWRKILPVKSIANRGQTSCWPCHKFQMLGLCGAGTLIFSQYVRLDGLLIKWIGDECKCPAHQVLKHCHENNGVIYTCSRNDGNGIVWFFPSGRTYPTDDRQDGISSTEIRQLLKATPKEGMYDKLKDLVLNPHLLLVMLGLEHENEPMDELRDDTSDMGVEDGHDKTLRGKGTDPEAGMLRIRVFKEKPEESGKVVRQVSRIGNEEDREEVEGQDNKECSLLNATQEEVTTKRPRLSIWELVPYWHTF
jgi:hypothetical protein